MTIVVSTESIGSLPRPTITDFGNGRTTREQGPREQDATGRDSDTRMEARDSPIMSDEEQCASSFATYPLTDKLAGPCREHSRRRRVLPQAGQGMHAARFLGASDRRSYQRPQVVTGLAHSRRVMEAIRSGMAMSAFQAWQQVSTMASKPGQTRRLSWFWRRYSQMFSTGLSSGL